MAGSYWCIAKTITVLYNNYPPIKKKIRYSHWMASSYKGKKLFLNLKFCFKFSIAVKIKSILINNYLSSNPVHFVNFYHNILLGECKSSPNTNYPNLNRNISKDINKAFHSVIQQVFNKHLLIYWERWYIRQCSRLLWYNRKQKLSLCFAEFIFSGYMY